MSLNQISRRFRYLAAATVLLLALPAGAVPSGPAAGGPREHAIAPGVPGRAFDNDGSLDMVPVATIRPDGTASIRCAEGTSRPSAEQAVASAPVETTSVIVTGPNGLTIEIVNANAAGVGFNDPTPAAPVGGNTGTTLGAQRLQAFQYAASLWASQLTSSVKVTVRSTFEALTCSSTSAVLGSAGAMQIFRDFSGAPRAATWYSGALASKLAGYRLDASTDDIRARFNSAIDDGSCGFPNPWYYGLDGAGPRKTIDLVTVVYHELGHGLGFQTFVSGTTGAKQGGYDDAFMVNLFDSGTGKSWTAMTDAERLASSTNTFNLLWKGAAVVAKAPSVLSQGIGAGGGVLIYAPSPYESGSSVSHWDKSLFPDELMEPTYTNIIRSLLVTGEAMNDIGWSTTTPTVNAWFLPSSARVGGQGGSFYTTDLTVANRTASAASVTLKFLGHDTDGRNGAESALSIGAGQAVTLSDVLGNTFNLPSGYGAIRVTSQAASLNVLGQTATPGPTGGTFGQSVPASAQGDLVTVSSPRSIAGVREDGSFRTNLILANATESNLSAAVTLVSTNGATLGSATYPLLPLGMIQVTQVVRDLGVTADVVGAQLLLSTPTAGGAFAAYASVIDRTTNDPRTLLPQLAGDAGPWILPSSARVSGQGGSFYTTDLTVANRGAADASVTLKFLGHDTDGRGGVQQVFSLGAGKTATYPDVLGNAFGLTSGYGAIRISSPSPSLNILGQTSTPGPNGGTFGQSVPAVGSAELATTSASRSIVAIREDGSFRTNLILANATEASLTVDAKLLSGAGVQLAAGSYSLPPLGMTQVTQVVRDLGIGANIQNAQLVLSTATAGGSFAAYASVIDKTTNDPRTLLPR